MSETVKSFEDLCGRFSLEKWKCDLLRETAIREAPRERGVVEKEVPRAPSGRRLSRWQLCLKEHMKGKFGPEYVREASRLYKEGKCPSGTT